MNQKLIKQFEFEFWSNTQILNAIKSNREVNPRANLLFSHLLSSHCMWLSRLNKTSFTCELFQERTLDECATLMLENTNGWKLFLESASAKKLESEIEFLSAWETHPRKRKITIDDAIVHLINHSSYHRGQIVALLKGSVQELPLTTYIMFASALVD